MEIIVTGRGTASGTPDRATVRLHLQTEGKSKEEARGQVREVADRITGPLSEEKSLSLEEDSYHEHSYMDQKGDWTASVSLTLTIEVSDLNMLPLLEASINGLGHVVNVQSVQYGVKDDTSLYTEARHLALRSALDAAETYREYLAEARVTPVRIEEGGGSLFMASEAGGGLTGIPRVPSEVTVTVDLRLHCQTD